MPAHDNATQSPSSPPARKHASASADRKAWMAATRPATLPAAIAPIVVGLALATRHAELNLLVAAATVFCALLIQIATNLANDYFDFKKGADTAQRLGPTRAVAAGLLSPDSVRNAAFAVLALAAVIGAFLVWHGGLPILAIGVAALLCAPGYTAGPLPLAYIGAGDLFVFLFFGLAAVAGTVWLQLGFLTTGVWPAASAMGALATAILVVNNLRDRHGDAAAEKRTLAVRFGARAARIEYVLCFAIAFGAAAWLALQVAGGAALALLAGIPAAAECRRVFRNDGAALNASLAGTAKIELLFAALLAAGLLL
ncbi:MAG: 1,4-dihydroxy-2-naphthoate octaprenyltransferase [Planctomycetota bacterium]|jgi:1,4-dihydroxy-2-naphthoate octaprenyltransferase